MSADRSEIEFVERKDLPGWWNIYRAGVKVGYMFHAKHEDGGYQVALWERAGVGWRQRYRTRALAEAEVQSALCQAAEPRAEHA